MKRFRRLGYEHAALNGQKGYHGVVVLSRLPFESFRVQTFCDKSDCRHVSAVLGERAGLKDPIRLHNFYVPAGGDIPDPQVNPKFAHKLAFLDEMRECAELRPGRQRAILLGDLNVAPLDCDVWSHKQMRKVVSHTPLECEKLVAAQTVGNWIDAMRGFVPEPTKLFTWWSYRSPDWRTADKGRRLDHIWVAPQLADRVSEVAVSKEARGWARPSDHVPVTATIEV
jgi:exodeoxyribonuclease-3